MKNGKCPMCDSTEVYVNRSVRFFASNTKVNLRDESGNIEAGAGFVPYICASCGFSALYVKEMSDIQALPGKAGWEKAGK